MTCKQGLFIVIEGCDRSGKSTQCQLLVDSLVSKGYPTILKKFPDRNSETGKIIDQYLKQSKNIDDHAIHLLFSSNRWEAMKEFNEILQSGNILSIHIIFGTSIVVDRYCYSGIAFSVAKGLDERWCRSPDEGLLKPDCVLFLDVLPSVAQQRGDYGDERYEKIEIQTKVRDIFLAMPEAMSWKIIDANRKKETIHQEMIQYVSNLMS